MNAPVVYRVISSTFESSEYHPTKKAALTSASWWQTKLDPDQVIEVSACYIDANLKRRHLHVRLLTGEGWMTHEEIIATLRGVNKDGGDAS